MRYDGMRQRSFEQSFAFVGVLLLAMGVLFFGIAIIVQVAEFQSTGRLQLLFLLLFALPGLGLGIGGGVMIARDRARRRYNWYLKQEGVCLTAKVAGYDLSNTVVNDRLLARMHCTYTDPSGTEFVFVSGLLHTNPDDFLPDGTVQVYCDKEDMSLYFVDVDGSVGRGDETAES